MGRDGAIAAREHVDTIVGDEHGVLELGRPFAVGGHGCPVVVPHLVLPGAEGDHRLDREDHARLHDHVVTSVVVVQHLNVGVELLTDAVADERPHHAVFVLVGVFFDGSANVGERAIGLHGLDALPHAFFGHADELSVGLVDLADEEGGVGVAVHAVEVAGDVEVDDVAGAQNGRVWDAVADHFVDRGAHAFRVAVVVEWARVGAGFDGEVVHQDVDVVGGDTGLHELAGLSQDVGGESAGHAHPFDDLGRLHTRFVPTRNLARVGVGRTGNVGRNGPHGRNDSGNHSPFHALVATLVLAT